MATTVKTFELKKFPLSSEKRLKSYEDLVAEMGNFDDGGG
jgi:hypothetical protein